MRESKFLVLITTLALTFTFASFTSTTFADESRSEKVAVSWKWTDQITSGAQYWRNIASSRDGSRLFASARNGYLYTSSNYGVTWTDRTPADSNPSISQWASVASSADGRKLVAVDLFNEVTQKGIYISNNYGLTWSIATLAISAQYWNFCAISSDGSRLVASDDNGDIYISSDFGTTWTKSTYNGPAVNGMAASDSGRYLVARINDLGLYTSNDYGSTWTFRSVAASSSVSSIASSSDGSHLVATAEGLGGGDIFTSSNYGVTWTDQVSAGTHPWTAVASSSDGSRLVASASNPFHSRYSPPKPGDIYTSSNYGVTWTDQISAGVQFWSSLTSNGDGTRIAAGVWGGDIVTGTFSIKKGEKSEDGNQ